jgi:hypothetical protein
MRTPLYAALILAACGRGGASRSSIPGGPAQKYAGTWEGRSYRSASDTGVPWRIVSAVAQDGSLRGTMTYTSVDAPPVPMRARVTSDTALVTELGPYHSLSANADVVTTATGKLRGDSLNGTFAMRPASGGAPVIHGMYRSKRVAP